MGWNNIIAKVPLKNKIIWFSIFIFSTFLICISFITVNLLNKTIISAEIKYANRNSLIIKNSISGLISNTENLLKILSTNPQIQEDLLQFQENKPLDSTIFVEKQTKFGQAVSNIIYPNTPIIGVAIWDKKLYYTSYPFIESEVTNILQNIQVQESNNQTILWSPLTPLSHQENNNVSVYPITKTVIHKEIGQTLGYITIFLDEQAVAETFDIPQEKSTNQDFYVISIISQKIISATDKSLLNKSVQEILYLNDSETSILSKNQHLLLGNQLYNILQDTSHQIYILTKTDLSLFFRNRRNQLFIIGLLVFGAIIAVSIGSYWLSSSITKPIYRIIEVMSSIKSGDLSSRIIGSIPDPELQNFAIAFNQLMDRLEQSIQEIYAQQQEIRKGELLLIQSQIKPHFLYNSMETISALIQIGSYNKALITLDNLAGFYRKTLHNGDQIISVKEEIEIISHYLELQSSRYSDVLDYTIEIDENILQYHIPKLILQPLVENAIYHGIKLKNTLSELIICGYKRHKYLHFEIYDTGIGIKAQKLRSLQHNLSKNRETSNSDSFGLISIQRRLHIFFGPEASVHIKSEEGIGTQVQISIPLKTGDSLL